MLKVLQYFSFFLKAKKEKEGNIHKSLGDRYWALTRIESPYSTRIAKCSYTKSAAREMVLGKVASKYTAAFLWGCDKWEAIGSGGGILHKLLVWTPCLMHRCVCVFDGTYYKITTTNYISKTSLHTTFRMYPLGPLLLKILMFALLVTREIATYSWPW